MNDKHQPTKAAQRSGKSPYAGYFIAGISLAVLFGFAWLKASVDNGK